VPDGSATALVLASASPRRAALLDQLGVTYTVDPADIDERARTHEAPNDYVRRIALEKAETVCGRRGRAGPVLGADTAVVIDDRIVGKPADFIAAAAILGALSGRWHEVYTGVALVHRAASVFAVRTRVKFRVLDDAEIAAYWDTGEPADKAGAYAIQGIGGAFVERIDGSYSNVVGLPLMETFEMLTRAGIGHALTRAGV
jgi:septum formation protein